MVEHVGGAMDRLTIMKSFVAVVKAESFSAAARSLGVSASLVSRHISRLEEELGVRLVNRTARAVSLTEQGERYFVFSERLLGELDQEDAAIRGLQERAQGSLAVVSPKWIGSLDLSDAVAAFAREYPQITVRFDVGGMGERIYDFIDKGYDLAFHTKYLRDSSVKVRRVATLPFVLCASPLYLRRNPQLSEPADLGHHACLVHRNDPVWHFEHDDGQQHHKVQTPAFMSNTYLVLNKAALEGLGVALLPLRPVFDDVRSGRLRVVLPEFSVQARPLYLIYPPGLQSVKKFRVFLDFMGEWFKRFPIDDAIERWRADGDGAVSANERQTEAAAGPRSTRTDSSERSAAQNGTARSPASL
jgi:DNA-binding transcriptional LysR family regulator